MKPDIAQTQDREEPVSLMEPMRISTNFRHRAPLADLSVDLAAHSAGFRRRLTGGVLSALTDLVRSMNCYFSNLIEGHDTHPLDVERALKNDYSANTDKRNLQLEARVHIAVQQWIDEGGLEDQAVSTKGICEIHKRFAERLPEELLWVEESDTKERMRVIPGALRRRVAAALTERGVLVSDTTRTPLRLAFPAKLAPRWMPGLFPEKSQ